MITGKQIRDARKRAGLSQADLATRVGVVPRTVGGWERGENSPGMAEPRLLAVLRDHLDDGSEPPLRSVSDVELLAEIARRFTRSTRQQKVEAGDGDVGRDAPAIGEVGQAEDFTLIARTMGRAPSGEQSDEERAAELGVEVVRPGQGDEPRSDPDGQDENQDEGVTGA